MRYRYIFLTCLMLLGIPFFLTAQRDTTQIKFSTEEIDPDQWNKKILFRKSSRTSVMDDATSILSIGVSVSTVGISYYGRKPVDLDIAYEHKVFTTGLYARVELGSRLAPLQEYDYDYLDHETLAGGFDRQTLGRTRKWLNFSLKYYYNKKRRMRSGRSGDSPFGQYIVLQAFRPVALHNELERSWRSAGNINNLLVSKRERTLIGSRRAAVGFAWGIQQRLFKSFVLDFHIGGYIRRGGIDFIEFPIEPSLSLKLGYLIKRK